MELRHLRYFVAVAENGGFTRGAEYLGLAQPPVSRQIAQLEAEIGVTLFERSGRTSALTPVGERFLEDARRILDDVESSTQRVRNLAAAATSLRVDFVPSAFAWVVPEILRRYQAEQTHGDIRLSERRPGEIVSALQDYQTDIGFIHQARPPNDGTIQVMSVIREGLVAALPANHVLAKQDAVDLSDLAPHDFILNQRDPSGGLVATILEMCRVAGFRPKAKQNVWLQQTTLGLVGAGMGVTLVPESAAQFARSGVTYRPLQNASTKVTVDLLWRSDATDEKVRQFISVATAWSQEIAGQPTQTGGRDPDRGDERGWGEEACGRQNHHL